MIFSQLLNDVRANWSNSVLADLPAPQANGDPGQGLLMLAMLVVGLALIITLGLIWARHNRQIKATYDPKPEPDRSKAPWDS